jgi:hypothetical protein
LRIVHIARIRAQPIFKNMKQTLNTILAALRFYQLAEQGDPVNRTDEIHNIATGNDEDVSLDEAGIDALITEIKTPCEHKPETYVGETAEGAGRINVYWCPECGSLRKSMIDWKCTQYPRQIPTRAVCAIKD